MLQLRCTLHIWNSSREHCFELRLIQFFLQTQIRFKKYLPWPLFWWTFFCKRRWGLRNTFPDQFFAECILCAVQMQTQYYSSLSMPEREREREGGPICVGYYFKNIICYTIDGKISLMYNTQITCSSIYLSAKPCDQQVAKNKWQNVKVEIKLINFHFHSPVDWYPILLRMKILG